MFTEIDPILAKHPGLVHRARFVSLRFLIQSSADRVQVEVDGQRVSAKLLAPGAAAPDCDFVLQAAQPAWAEFSKTHPRPGFQDILALIEAGHASFSGNGLAFFRNLFLVKGIVFAVFRGDAAW